MASGASPRRIVGRTIMQGDDLVRGTERAVAAIALGAAQCDEMAIGLDVTHRVTGDAGDGHWRRRAGVTHAFCNGILDILADGVAMADHAIALMDDVDITHVGCDMTGCAADSDRNHVMLDCGRWNRMVEGILRPVAVGAILPLIQGRLAILDGCQDLWPPAAVAFDTGVLAAAEGHDVNNTGSAGVGAIMAVRTEGIGAQVVHVIAPGLNMAEGAVGWGVGKLGVNPVVMRWLFYIMTMDFVRSDSGDRIDQIVMVTGFAINDLGAGFAVFDGGHDLGCDRSSIDASGVSLADAVCRVGVAIGAEVVMDVEEPCEIIGGVTATAILEDIGGAAHFVMVGITVLDAACKRMAGLAVDRNWVATTAAACRNGVLDFLDAAAVTGLAIAAMGGVDVSKGAARVAGIAGREVAGDGAIGSRAQHVVAGVGIMGGDA